MKKKIIPSKGLFALSIFEFFFVAVLLCGCIEKRFFFPVLLDILLDAIRTPSVFNIVMAVITTAIWPLFIIPFAVVIYGSFEQFLFAGRPVKFSEDIIRLGYIKKKRYCKKDITGIGIAPTIYGSLFETWKSKTLGIYIAFGDYKKSDFSDYGIMSVWEMTEFRKVWPQPIDFTNRIGAKLSRPDCSKIQPLDGLLWMKYTEENMRFLKEWLGDRFEEVI